VEPVVRATISDPVPWVLVAVEMDRVALVPVQLPLAVRLSQLLKSWEQTTVAVGLKVMVGVEVTVAVEVRVAVEVAVARVPVGVRVGVEVQVAVRVGVGLFVAVGLAVGVKVAKAELRVTSYKVPERKGRASVKLAAVKAGAAEGERTEMAESNRKARMEEICWPAAKPLKVTLAVLLAV
jgi:hypothetical protein